MKYNFYTLILTLIALPFTSFAQERVASELPYEVLRVYPSISINKEKLAVAHTLTDLNSNYKSGWVRSYLSVEVLTSHQGKTRKAVSKNATLSQEQIDRMKTADVGTDISVKVQYIPENTLAHNDAKEMGFTFTVNPEIAAEYPGGQQALKKHLKKEAIDKIPAGVFQNYDLAAVKFTIDEAGKIVDSQLFNTSKDEQIDALLLETVQHLPNWKPAEYSDGTKVKQEFVLTVGNMENCMINLLNIHRS